MALRPITIESNSRFCGLVIGPAGIGKTSLLRSIPESERVCVVSAEAGLLCVRDLVASGRVEGFEVASFAEMAEVHQFLTTSSEAKARYQWVFIDSLTEISTRCVEAMKAKYPDRKDSFPMWGEYGDRMTALVKGFRDLRDYNVIFTCLDSTEKDDLNRRFSGPQISGGALKERLSSYFDEVFYMTSMKDPTTGQEGRYFVTQPYDRFPAKDRSGKLELVERPHLAAVKAKILSDMGTTAQAAETK